MDPIATIDAMLAHLDIMRRAYSDPLSFPPGLSIPSFKVSGEAVLEHAADLAYFAKRL